MSTSARKLPDTEEREIRETFELFDSEGTNKISRDDAAKVIRSMGYNPTEQELLDMFQAIDADGMEAEGQIEVNDFILYYSKHFYDPTTDQEEIANEAFKQFDPKGRGCVELHELKSILTNFGEDTFSDVEFRKILREVKVDEEGMVYYAPFIKMMNQRYN